MEPYTALYVYILVYIHLTKGAFTHTRRPLIDPGDEEFVIDSQNNKNFSCIGVEPVTWTYPNETTEDYNFWSSVNVFTSESPNLHHPHRSLLTITNASYLDTGYYYCHGMTAPKDDPNRSSKIYIYVRDENHLSVVGNSDIKFIQVPQFSNATLPCRPTSPDVRVTLIDINGVEVDAINYDPKQGFTLTITSLLFSGYYTCNFKLGHFEEEISIHLNVIPVPTEISKPYIAAPNSGRTSVGQTLTLNCTINVDGNVYFDLFWDVPDKSGLKNGRVMLTNATATVEGNDKKGYSVLTIKDVQSSDEGTYKCSVKDHVNNTNYVEKYITVLGKGESHINLTAEIGMHTITVSAGTPKITWVIIIDAYPEVDLIWKNNKGDEIIHGTKNSKYTMKSNQNKATLMIHQITLNDSGVYQIIGNNGIDEKVLNLTLIVLDKPAVEIESPDFHTFGTNSTLHCLAAGYPLPNVIWWFKPCLDETCSFKIIHKSRYSVESTGLQAVSTLHMIANQSGIVKCDAYNDQGNDTITTGYFITDVDESFQVWGLDENSLVAVEDDVEINCAASIYNYTNNLNWFIWSRDGQMLQLFSDERRTIVKNKTDYTYRIVLRMNSITENEAGTYACVAHQNDADIEEVRNISINVNKPLHPKITKTNMNGTLILVKAGKPIELYCEATGIPLPQIIWKKDNKFWSVRSNESHIRLSEDKKRLLFTYLDVDDSGEYSCTASNRIGSEVRSMRLTLDIEENSKTGLLIGITIFLVFVLICIVAILVFKIQKEKKLQRELKKAGLSNFEEGALESLNPDLGVDDQAELLPYDKKWEFPRDKLKLGKQLGSGAFGVVMKAEAFGLVEGETLTTVAVKMVKRNADCTYIKALASELKIMVHLGKHLNVVNLLGACTKNVAKRELLVIVEYCRFGNLHNYLLRHRDDFINQIHPVTGAIDSNFRSEFLCRSMSLASNQSGSKFPASSAGVDYRLTPNPSSSATDSTVCGPSGEDCMILSNNSVQPEWRSNYRGDYKGNVRPISTHDLLCWAFQVARGMEYLASRKVLHGDLAARNILLAEENIVKICDFGLAKSMYKSDNYKKKGEGPLPVKWMAIESIRDRVFSTQSDVWSYGIVLWEFFSLARTPYPGMDADERLYNKLIDGYRMEQPQYSTKEIYQIMLDCWHAKPLYRPSFTNLAEDLGCMLQESVRQHYIELNDPYLHMNNVQREAQSDYLAMLSPPDYGNLASPAHNYVNDISAPPQTPDEASGYLPMDIFSPKPASNIFDFETQKKKLNDKECTGVELLPILTTNVESDGEMSPLNLVGPSNSFANPSYQIAPIVDDKKVTAEPIKEELVSSSDNYINMSKQKSALKNNAECFSNPSYINFSNKEDDKNNYVNSFSRDWERV